MIRKFEVFEKMKKTDSVYKDIYIHKNFIHSDTIINPISNEELKNYLYADQLSNIDRKSINNFFKKHTKDSIVLYHGTNPNHDIMGEGLLKTSSKRRLSYQSTAGFVYLAIFPDTAKLYSDIGYGISNSQVYEVTIPIEYLTPDKDNLANKRVVIGDDVQYTLADSLVFAHSFAIKGNIPPYMIKKYEY